jgi:hypothetical protein
VLCGLGVPLDEETLARGERENGSENVTTHTLPFIVTKISRGLPSPLKMTGS